MVDKLTEAMEQVAPEMQAAWMDYDPAAPMEAGMNLARVSGLVRHAFFSGYKAAALSRPNVDEMREALETLADEVMTTINDVVAILHPEPSDEPLHAAAARATNLALAVGRARAIAAGAALTKEEAEENCRRLTAGEPTLSKAGFAALGSAS